MVRLKHIAGALLLALVFQLAAAQPLPEVKASANCADLCTRPEDFVSPLPALPDPTSGTRSTQWTVVILKLIKLNYKALSPPAIARMLGVSTCCMYDAAALFHADWIPMMATNHTKWDVQDDGREQLLDAAVSGAAYAAILNLFHGLNGTELAEVFLNVTGDRDDSVGGAAFAEGFDVCNTVIEQRREDGANQYGTAADALLTAPYADTTNYFPVNDAQTAPAITDCSNLRAINRWQPICVPKAKWAFERPYDASDCKSKPFAAPWAAYLQPAYLPAADFYLPSEGPPLNGSPRHADWEADADEVLHLSAALEDSTKLKAEYWADGPDTTAPPGHWMHITITAADDKGLNASDAVRLVSVMGNALMDAGISAWTAKRFYDGYRPLQMIQCLHVNESVLAWQGPYMGVGQINGSEWLPYQLTNFVTPPFPGYVSGHSTFSAAAATVLQLFFGSDEYVGARCRLYEAGSSAIEPYIGEEGPGYQAGVTDVPNMGPESVGYTPRNDTVLCWDTYSAAAEEAGYSRLLGGIHTASDNVAGLAVGRSVGQWSFDRASELWGIAPPKVNQ